MQSIGQSLVGLVVIGYIQFMATICGATGSIFFFSFGDSVTKRKQALLLTSSYLILCLIVTLSLFITLIYWIVTGLYGAQGPYFLACSIFSRKLHILFCSVLLYIQSFVSFRIHFSRYCFSVNGLENVCSLVINLFTTQ